MGSCSVEEHKIITKWEEATLNERDDEGNTNNMEHRCTRTHILVSEFIELKLIILIEKNKSTLNG